MKERELFLAALGIEDPTARQAHLKSECAGDAELLARVEALLASHESQSQFLNKPAIEQIGIAAETDTAATMLYGGGSTQDADQNDDPNATSAYEATKPASQTDGNEAHDDEDDSENVTPLGYLEPSTQPGSLGRLGHYEVLEVIGRGAFGTVMRAFDEKLHRVVAIKVMSPEMAATSPARKRFIREAQASAAIRHEHVVSIHAVEEKPLPYLVMEYIPGVTLQQRLEDVGPLDVPTVLRLGRQIAEGLAAAHAQDLIHRDVKPANILLETGAREMVKVTDFGLARAADDSSVTQSGLIAGTPMYMAPEQALGQKLDTRADLFSLGSVLYLMVSGRPPFRAPNTVAVLKRVTEETPRAIREIIPETPQWLCDIISKLHAKNPDERYQTAQEVADVLADCEAQLKAHAGLKDYGLIPQSKPQAETQPTAPPTTQWWKGIAAAVVVLLLVVLGVMAFKRPTVERDVVQRGESQSTTTNAESSHSTASGSSPASTQSPEGSTPPMAKAPFDAAQARTHQDVWAKHLDVPVEYTNSLGMKLRLIPPGEFTMGTPAEEVEELVPNGWGWARDGVASEAPERHVLIRQPFYMGTTEVTIDQFKSFVDATSYKTTDEASGKGGFAYVAGEQLQQPDFTWRHPDVSQSGSHPVAQLTAQDVNAFCEWLSREDGLTYALPDEEQWEYACRAGTTTRWNFGNDPAIIETHALANQSLASKSQPVAQRRSNSFGLFDMHGNVEELCRQPGGGFRGRSGHGGLHPLLVRSASRSHGSDVGAVSYRQRGFRVVIVGDHLPKSDTGAKFSLARKSSLPPTFTNTIGMEFVVVPKGKSWLGGGANRPGKLEVEIPADFYLGKFEVTQDQWRQVMNANPSSCNEGTPEELPVESISWFLTQDFITKLNERVKDTGWTYRLPTEIEWEYACRGGPMNDRSQSRFDFYFATPATSVLPTQANLFEETTTPVGSYSPNPLGLYDMHGNVHEWCLDQAEDASGMTFRAHRGGCWKYGAGEGAAGIGGKFPGHQMSRHLGLRLARVPVPPPSSETSSPPAPFTTADAQRLAELPVRQRIDTVVVALKARNRGLDGTPRYNLTANKLTDFTFQPFSGQDAVTDLTPLLGLPDLKSLNFWGCSGLTDLQTLKAFKLNRLVVGSFEVKNSIPDLEPLRGMPLSELRISHSPIQNLEPLRGMPLSTLRLVGCGQIKAFEPLKGMPLIELHLAGTSLSDLSVLQGMPLKRLCIQRTAVTDLTPLKNLELDNLIFGLKSITQGLETLRNMPSLSRIGIDYDQHWSAKEFWERYDKGEFAK